MLIKSAIQNRCLLAFTYDGFSRLVEPHTYGIDNKGHSAMRGYQVRGGGESGENVDWKMFHTSKMRQVTVMPEHFLGPRPKYKRGDSAFSTIYSQL